MRFAGSCDECNEVPGALAELDCVECCDAELMWDVESLEAG